ncbi:MAG: GAF and ANTAR domain-containing protein [Mycobacteriales bacterium]
MDGDEELAESLAGLTGLLLTRRPLTETLTQVAEFAVHAIPGAQGAGLTLLEANRPQTVVATDEFVREVDRIQYEVADEGPCLSAVAERRTFTSGNLGGEAQWTRFGPRVGRLGVHSALSLPLLLPDRVLGALNVYAHGRDAFGPPAVQLGEAFAQQAAASVSNAQLLAQADRLIAQLEQSLQSRAEIDQAVGLLMSRTGLDADGALDRLRSMSQASSVKVSELARDMLATAVKRARARAAQTPDRESDTKPDSSNAV